MFKRLFLVHFLLSYVVLCGGQVLQFGTCPDLKTVQFFDIEEFLGQWYEIERIPNWYEQSGNCAFKRIQYCSRRVQIEHVYVRDGIRFVLPLNTTYVPGDEAVFVVQESNIDAASDFVRVELVMLQSYWSQRDVIYPKAFLD